MSAVRARWQNMSAPVIATKVANQAVVVYFFQWNQHTTKTIKQIAKDVSSEHQVQHNERNDQEQNSHDNS